MESSHPSRQVLHPIWKRVEWSKVESVKAAWGNKWIIELKILTWLVFRVWIIDFICSVICSISLSINSACSYLKWHPRKKNIIIAAQTFIKNRKERERYGKIFFLSHTKLSYINKRYWKSTGRAYTRTQYMKRKIITFGSVINDRSIWCKPRNWRW